MNYKTYGELKLKVQRETDTEAEDFVQDDELMGYFQDAVNEAEANIHKLGLEDDYFLSKASMDMTIGQSVFNLPSDIYANKIRAFYFVQQTMIFPVKRLKGRDKFMLADSLRLDAGTTNYYGYILFNYGPTVNPVIELYPVSNHQGTGLLKMAYIRNAIEIEDSNSIVDIPEFYSFIIAFVKWKIYDKEGSAKADSAKSDLEAQRVLMVATLEQMVPDDDNEIPIDSRHYEEST